MYIDTDCILALVKESDWLKDCVRKRIKDDENLCTSVQTVVECRLVLLRESSFNEVLRIEGTLEDWGIKLISLDETILDLSKDLMIEYKFLGTFDALHVATALHLGETILSTDHVFPMIEGLHVEDPRGE